MSTPVDYVIAAKELNKERISSARQFSSDIIAAIQSHNLKKMDYIRLCHAERISKVQESSSQRVENANTLFAQNATFLQNLENARIESLEHVSDSDVYDSLLLEINHSTQEAYKELQILVQDEIRAAQLSIAKVVELTNIEFGEASQRTQGDLQVAVDMGNRAVADAEIDSHKFLSEILARVSNQTIPTSGDGDAEDWNLTTRTF